LSRIDATTSAFKFSQIEAQNVNKATALFILANLGALRLKERSVLVGLIAELCKHISGTDATDFTPPSLISVSAHLGDRGRYQKEKLQRLANGEADFDSDFVSRSVALAELVERNA
jgi:hypothetical protein